MSENKLSCITPEALSDLGMPLETKWGPVVLGIVRLPDGIRAQLYGIAADPEGHWWGYQVHEMIGEQGLHCPGICTGAVYQPDGRLIERFGPLPPERDDGAATVAALRDSLSLARQVKPDAPDGTHRLLRQFHAEHTFHERLFPALHAVMRQLVKPAP